MKNAAQIEENKAKQEAEQAIASGTEPKPTSDSVNCETPRPKYKRGMNPNSRKNLKMWIKGQSGHPGGRRKDIASELSRAVIEDNFEAIASAIRARLLSGDAYAYSVHADRAYGKQKQGMEVTGADGGSIDVSLKVEFVNGSPEKK